MRIRILLLLLSLLTAPAISANMATNELITVHYTGEKQNLSHLMQFTYTTENESIDDVRFSPESRWEYKSSFNEKNLHKIEKNVWIRIRINNSTPANEKSILRIDYPHQNEIKFYQFENNELIQSFITGSNYEFTERPILQRTFWFPLKEIELQDIYLRISTDGPLLLPIDIISYSQAIEEENLHSIWTGIFFGMIIILIIYNFFLGLSLKDSSHIFFSIFLLSSGILQITIMGYGQQFFWGHIPALNESILAFMIPLTLFWGVVFGISFIELYSFGSSLEKSIAHLLVMTAGGVSIASFAIPYHYTVLLGAGLSLIAMVAGIYAGIRGWYLGNRAARLFTLAWLAHSVFLLWFLLDVFSLIQSTSFGSESFTIGFILEFVFITLASADKINQERELRVLSQTKLLDMQVAMNKELDEMVKERTTALEKANTKLHDISIKDGLTNLHNRRYFDRIYREIFTDSYNHQHPVSVMMIDIDYFKNINDSCGHAFGDLCLVTAAKIINNVVTMEDAVTARYGGEEFALVFPKTTEKRAIQIGESLRREFESTQVTQDNSKTTMTVSIGVASAIPDHPDKAEKLLQQADQHLYCSKENGRNQVTYSLHPAKQATHLPANHL